MSRYSNSESAEWHESEKTKTARIHVQIALTSGFKKKGLLAYKILHEVPATFADVKYTADFGVLITRPDYSEQFFILVEIDGDVGHGTPTKNIHDNDRDETFILKHGILTMRIPLNEAWNVQTYAQAEELFLFYIWKRFFDVYINPTADSLRLIRSINITYAAQLADNCIGTKCTDCVHLLHDHDLTGCDHRFKEEGEEKSLCMCHKPFLRSVL